MIHQYSREKTLKRASQLSDNEAKQSSFYVYKWHNLRADFLMTEHADALSFSVLVEKPT
jgi:hypothetical protein